MKNKKDMIDLEIYNKIIKFRDERNWKQFHNPKDLAISINLEAAELLEIFQWSGEDLFVNEKIDMIKEELADIFIYSIYMADICNLDLNEIILSKLQNNSNKYPINKSYGKSVKYTEIID